MNYRREIDGLRAVAVLPIIFFHAGVELFSGGFVGVDVFFVISGYLITSIILTEKQEGAFSLVGFYERRARRILPALFFVMLVCVPFAWLWMLPSAMKDFSQSLVAVSVFASNIFFMDSRYFVTAAEVKPLLHTWSLAVEEQYYLLFPLFLLMTWRLGKRWVVGILVVIAVVSLAVAQWGSLNKPEKTFYLLPARGWELLIGVFIAFYLFAKGNEKKVQEKSGEFGSLVGLLLIVYSVFAFDETTPFPSLYALMPTVGAAFLILFATPQTLVGKLLASKLLVGIGLISYSAYLWHQPMLAFARVRIFEGPSPYLLLFLAASSMVLAYVSWRYIELPFRDRNCVSRRTVLSVVLVMGLILICMGAYGELKNGFDERLSIKERDLISYLQYKRQSLYREGLCFLEPEQRFSDFSTICSSNVAGNGIVILWGDSHAAALSSGFRAVLSNFVQYTASACPPAVGVSFRRRPHCKDINDFVLGEVNRIKPSLVLLHANWSGYKKQNVLSSISNTIRVIGAVSPTSKILVVGSVPQWSRSLPELMVRSKITLDKISYIDTPRLSDLRKLDESYRIAALNNGVLFFSALDVLCKNETCLAVAEMNGRYEPIAWDNEHLTEAGSLLLVKKLGDYQTSGTGLVKVTLAPFLDGS